MRQKRKKYRYVVVSGHPYSTNHGKGLRAVMAHRLVAEKAIGHYLHPRHPVHHVNGDVNDNRPSNLVICENGGYHSLLHLRQGALEACGDPSWRSCPYCQVYGDPSTMTRRRNRLGSLTVFVHHACERKYYNGWYQRTASKRVKS